VEPYHPSRLLLRVHADADARAVDAALEQRGARVLHDLPQIGWRVIELLPGLRDGARRELAASGLFARVDLDRARPLAHVPNDPYWSGMWHMTKIDADDAWDRERGDPAVVVAIMDTGLEWSHPDLAPNAWTNPGEIDANGLDDDGNGYVDDVHGWDFAYGDSAPDDVYGHGTSCAGIVAAAQDNSLGVTGVAPLCRLMPIKAAIDSGYFYDSANVPALVYAADMGAKVVSMSFFSDQVTPAERDAIDYCWQNGLLPVAAAGNSSSVLPYYPAAYDHVLAVGATNPSDLRSYFSDLGSWVSVAAPGEGLSTVLPQAYGSYTTAFAGTSGSAPHVAGLAALLFSAAPSASPDDVRAAIEDGALTLDEWPYGEWTRYGRVDCNAALDRVLGLASGSKPARVLFASPCGGSGIPASPGSGAVQRSAVARPSVTWHGVGFELPQWVQVEQDGRALALSVQARSSVTARLSSNLASSLSLDVNGAPTAALLWDATPGLVWAPSDAGTAGSGVPLLLGGFWQLYRDDGALLTCTRRDDGLIYVELAVRGVQPASFARLRIEATRGYDACAGGTETIELYDWSTWSYPYGSFTTVANTPIADASTSTITSEPSGDPQRFLDDEGTLYVRITTSGAAPGALLRMDSFRVRLW
jgi:hypothetical protein